MWVGKEGFNDGVETQSSRGDTDENDGHVFSPNRPRQRRHGATGGATATKAEMEETGEDIGEGDGTDRTEKRGNVEKVVLEKHGQ